MGGGKCALTGVVAPLWGGGKGDLPPQRGISTQGRGIYPYEGVLVPGGGVFLPMGGIFCPPRQGDVRLRAWGGAFTPCRGI